MSGFSYLTKSHDYSWRVRKETDWPLVSFLSSSTSVKFIGACLVINFKRASNFPAHVIDLCLTLFMRNERISKLVSRKCS